MNKIEKLYNSTFYKVFDFIYKLVMFNLLFVLTTILGLGVFSYMVALIILVLAIKSLINDHDYSIVKTWVINIKKYLKDTLIFGLLFTLVGLIFTYNTMFFFMAISEETHTLNYVFFYVMLIIDLLYIFAVINTAVVYVYFPNLSRMKTIRYSVELIKVVPLQAIFLLLMMGGLVVALFVAPILLAFIGFSLTMYLYCISINSTYTRLQAHNSNSLDIRDV